MYQPLANGGAIGRVRLVNRDQLVLMGAASSATSVDFLLLVPTRLTMGYFKTVDNRYLPPADSEGVLMAETAFGHTGFGGSHAFADPALQLSFGYTANRQGPGLGVNERGQSLINAVYQAFGYRLVPGGFVKN
jgi:CubicO group peptidase (beta-lactamase class C family)